MDERTPLLMHLLRGVLYRDQHERLWAELLRLRGPVADYFTLIGLDLVLDEVEGYAFLRQPRAESLDGSEEPLPRLVRSQPLSYPVSLLCVLLRKRLAEADSTGGETRLILTRAQMVDMLRLFLPEQANEARLIDQIDAHIQKVLELGFLRELKGQSETYEVCRIIKALVDTDWLVDLEEKLRLYREHALGSL